MAPHSPFPIDCPPSNKWSITDNSFIPGDIWKARNAACIKGTATRKVIIANNYYLKFFRTGGQIKRGLRDPAKKEFEIACHLHNERLTAEPAGWVYHRGWSCFAARKVEGEDLSIFLRKKWHSMPETEKKKICKLFAELLARLGGLGFFQPDFHLNNILYDPKMGKFAIIDLHRAQIYNAPLDRTRRARQLSFVLPPILDIVNQRHILECVSYLSKSWEELRFRENRFEIVEQAYSDMRRHWTKRGLSRLEVGWKRQDVDSGFLQYTKAGGREPLKLLSDFHRQPDKTIKGCEKILKNSRHTLCLLLSDGNYRAFLKAYRSSGHLKSISYLLRRPKVLRLWEKSWLIASRRLPVMLPVAMLQLANPWRPFYGALLYEYDRDAEAGKWKEDIREIIHHKHLATIFLKRLASQLWSMHQRGIFHGDCKISNFIADRRGYVRCFFDIDSARIVRKISDSKRISDIVCMAASIEKLAASKDATPAVGTISSAFFQGYLFCHLPWQSASDDIHERLIAATGKKIEKSLGRKEFYSERH